MGDPPNLTYISDCFVRVAWSSVFIIIFAIASSRAYESDIWANTVVALTANNPSRQNKTSFAFYANTIGLTMSGTPRCSVFIEIVA